MSDTQKYHLGSNDCSQAWDVLAAKVDALTAAWEAGPPNPDIAALLPGESDDLRRMILVELIKVDLEYRWQSEVSRKTLSEYVAEFPELVAELGIPCDLVFEEFHIRRRAGDEIHPQAYYEQFPEQRSQLERLLEIDQTDATTTLASTGGYRDIQIGEDIDDFKLLTPLGRGAFARVFLARQKSMQRLVALKISKDEGDEPQTLGQLDHPYVVRVFDTRSIPDRNLRLMYMQYVPGGTLHPLLQLRRAQIRERFTGQDYLRVVDQALEQAGQIPPVESSTREFLAGSTWGELIAWLGARIAIALDYAHSRNVLHRDVKPANVLIDAEGSPRLADFNISFCSKVDGASPAAFFGGSLPYMSPEQLEVCSPKHDRKASEIDERADIYSLGVMLWELLTGRLPQGVEKMSGDWAETLQQMIERRRAGELECVAGEFESEFPPGLTSVIEKCIEAEPGDRWQSGAELAQQLQLCLEPEIRDILNVRGSGIRSLCLDHPVMTSVAAAIVPNIFAGALNLAYNYSFILSGLDDNSNAVFVKLCIAINSVAFPLGCVVGLLWFYPLARALSHPPPGDGGPAFEPWLRRRCLNLGSFIAALSLAEWLVAGPLFPFCFYLLGGEPGPTTFYHFFASMTICGLIAATYPFFFLSLLSTRVFYPAMIASDTTEGVGDRDLLHRVAWRSNILLAVGAAVPMLSVFLVVSIGTGSRQVLYFLSGIGVVGFLLSFAAYRRITRDVGLLLTAVSGMPAGSGVSSDTTRRSTRS